MTGVCAVFESSEWPGITRTPSCFHFGSVIAFLVLVSSRSVPQQNCAALEPICSGSEAVDSPARGDCTIVAQQAHPREIGWSSTAGEKILLPTHGTETSFGYNQVAGEL